MTGGGNGNTLIIIAVPAPEAASNPTAIRAWDQWNLERDKVPDEVLTPVEAGKPGCKVCCWACCWMFDDDFNCPSVRITISQVQSVT